MKRLLPLLFLAACGAPIVPCDETNPILQRGCDREDRAVIERAVTPPDDDHEPDDDEGEGEDDPEPEHDSIDDPDYRAWRERQGRPLP